MSVITGATTRTRSESSSRKQAISLARGPFTPLAPLPQAYCWATGTAAVAFAKLRCCRDSLSAVASR